MPALVHSPLDLLPSVKGIQPRDAAEGRHRAKDVATLPSCACANASRKRRHFAGTAVVVLIFFYSRQARVWLSQRSLAAETPRGLPRCTLPANWPLNATERSKHLALERLEASGGAEIREEHPFLFPLITHQRYIATQRRSHFILHAVKGQVSRFFLPSYMLTCSTEEHECNFPLLQVQHLNLNSTTYLFFHHC